MTEKLTPRVGDRVLVIRGFDARVRYSKCGWVRGFTESGGPLVDIDGVAERVMVPLPHLEVLDRAVEWPKGWADHAGFDAVRFYGKDRVGGVSMTRGDLEHILATGPEMIARWDELKGES